MRFFFPKYISVKFDICSTHKRGVVIKHFRLQIQAVMLTNPLFHTVMCFSGKNTYVFLLLLIFASPLIFLTSFMRHVYGKLCSFMFLFLQAYFLYKRPAWYKTLQDISHHCFTLQTPTLFSTEHLQKMCNIKLKI